MSVTHAPQPLERRAETHTPRLRDPGGRRELLTSLQRVLRRDEPLRCLLAIFDLDGMQRYNSAFGNAAGDLLLHRLGRNLAVAAPNRSYRLGGDDFCILTPLPTEPT